MNHSQPERTHDPREQFERLLAFTKRTLRYWWVVLVALVVGAAACAAFFHFRTPPYKSETVLLYSEGINATDASATATTPAHTTAVRLREMLMSRARLEALIEQFGLYPEIVQKYGLIDAVEEFREHIDFKAPGSDTYTIGFVGTSPDEARDVTAALADSLIEEDRHLRRTKAEITRDFLAKEEGRTEEALKEAELALAEFLAEHPGFALDSMLLMPGANPTGAAIRAAEAEQPDTSSETRRGRHVYRRVKAKASAGKPAEIPGELTAEKARAEADVNAARADLADKLTRYTRQHPDVAAAEVQLNRAQARLTSATAAIAEAMASERPSASSRETKTVVRRVWQPAPKSAKEEKKETKRSSEQLVELETDWSRLVRDVNEARARHEQIEASLFRADIAASSESGGQAVQMAIIDPAYLPTRMTPPGPLTITGIFVVLSLLVGGLLALGCAAIDDRVFGRRELDDVAPLLVAVPKHES